MEVHLTKEQVALLAQIGSADGKPPEQVAEDILTRSLTERQKFREAVQRGIASADRGEFIEEEEMDARVQRMFPQ